MQTDSLQESVTTGHVTEIKNNQKSRPDRITSSLYLLLVIITRHVAQ
jgi:hypothetical protein